MKRFSADETRDARQALAEHTAATCPQNNLPASGAQNDWTKSPTLWNGPVLNITDARSRAHALLAAENAAKQSQ